jgi:Carboxypeptidase regulatory-like domain
MRIPLALLFAFLACYAQNDAPQKGAAGPCSVEGLVLNAVTGEPLNGAELTLVGAHAEDDPSPLSATSDENGKYRIRGVAPGRYLLVARKPGFTTSYGPDGALTSNSSFVLDLREKTKEFVVRLAPYGAIAGRIQDEAGKPAAGAFALAYRVGTSRTGKRLYQVGRDIAGATGAYHFAGLPPGKYYISAIAAGGLGGRSGTAVTYYPGTIHFETAVALDLAAGTDLPNIDLRLAKAGTVCVHLRAGAPRDGLQVSLSARHSIAPAWSYTALPAGEKGRFEACGLLPGDYDAVASDEHGYSSRQAVHVDESSGQEIRLHMPPQTDIAGRIVFEGEGPGKPAGRVELRPVNRSVPAQEATLDEAGGFTFRAVNPGAYVVTMTGVAQGFYVSRIRAGGVDVLGKTLELAGISPGVLEIGLSPNVGAVRGIVHDALGEKPAAGAIIVLLPEEPERQDLEMFFGAALADGSGGFSIASLAPGRYRAIAFEAVEETGAMTDPDLRRALRSKGDPVEVREKYTSNLGLKVRPASDLR